MKSPFLALLKKEISAYFTSYIGYFVIFLYLFLCGVFTFYYGRYFINKSISLDSFFMYQPQIFMLIIPAIIMRSFSDERKTGVFEVTMSFPLKIRTIVLSKFFSSFFISVLMLALTIAFVIYSSVVMNLDISIISYTYFIYLFIIAMFCSISLLLSSFSPNSIVSYLLSSIVLWCLLGTEFSFIVKPFAFISDNIYFDLEKALSFKAHSESFLSGNISLDSFIYFISITFVTIYLTIYTLGKNKQKYLVAILMVLLIIIINITSGYIFSNKKFDITTDKIYSLSDESRKIAGNVSGAIYIKIYISENLSNYDYSYYKYAKNVINFIEKYSSENINVDIRIVKTGSLQEQEAKDAGISPFLVGNGSEFIYFGAVFDNLSGKSSVIPNFIIERSRDLESDITKTIYNLSNNSMKKIGWVNALEKNTDDVMLKGLLSSEYKIINISPKTLQIPFKDVDCVVVTNFQDISYMLSYAIDQYILLGGKVLFLLDSKNSVLENIFAKDMLDSLNVYYEYNLVVTDNSLADMVVGIDKGYKRYIKNITSLNLHRDNINNSSEITRGIRNLNFTNSLYLKTKDEKTTSLAQSSNTIGVLPNSTIRQMNGEYISNNFNTIGETANLAILSQGKKSSIFYENIVSEEKHQKQMPPYISTSLKDYKAIVLSSSSFLDMDNYNLVGDILSLYSITNNNDNLKFITNSINYLSGNNYVLKIAKNDMIYNDKSIFDEISYTQNEIYSQQLFDISKEITIKEKKIAEMENQDLKYFSMKKIQEAKLAGSEVYKLKSKLKVLENKMNYKIQSIIDEKIAFWTLFFPAIEVILLFILIKIYYFRKRQKVLEVFNEK